LIQLAHPARHKIHQHRRIRNHFGSFFNEVSLHISKGGGYTRFGVAALTPLDGNAMIFGPDMAQWVCW
jgi:hypothetical protein